MKIPKFLLEEPEVPKVYRTRAATIMEIVAALLNIALWIFALIMWRMGKVDFGVMLIACISTNIVSVLGLWAAYHPQHINVPVSMKNMRQWQAGIMMSRVTAIEAPLFFGVPMLFGEDGWPIFVGVGLLVLTDIAFTVYIFMIRK